MNGLNRDIANVVELEHYMKLDHMEHMAMKAERQLKRKGATMYSSGSNPSWKLKWGNNNNYNRTDGAISKSKTESPSGKEEVARKK